MNNNIVVITTERLRDSLETSSNNGKQWFEDRTHLKTRSNFEKKRKLWDKGTGAVYVYLDSDGRSLYVGQNSRRIKARLHDQTSPHKEKEWWSLWTHIRFSQLEDDMDRLTLKYLLILACAPKYNMKPKSKNISDLFL